MAQEDNVVKLPDLLERRAIKIEAAMVRRTKGRTEWIEGTIELAIELAGAKADHNSTQEFGKWFTDRFSNPTISKDERPILARWGAATADEIRAVLEKDESTSIQGIDNRNPGLGVPVRTYTKPAAPPPPPPKTTMVREEVKDVIRAHKAQHGVYPSVAEVTQESKRSRIVAEPALAAVIAEDTIAPKTFTFTKAQDAQLEARLKVLDRQRAATFEARVQEEYQKRVALMFPNIEKLREDATRKEKTYREALEKIAILKEPEYMDILKTCHPDNSASKEVRERAFITVQSKKLQLTGKA